MVSVNMEENQDAEKPVNMHWPRTGMRATLDENSFKTLGFLTKIQPTEAFGAEAGLTEVSKLDFTLKVKDDVEKIANMVQPETETEVQGPVSNGGPTAPEQTSGTHEMGTGPDTGYNPNDFGSAGGEDRQCPVCTFFNPASNKECEIC